MRPRTPLDVADAESLARVASLAAAVMATLRQPGQGQYESERQLEGFGAAVSRGGFHSRRWLVTQACGVKVSASVGSPKSVMLTIPSSATVSTATP